METKRLLDSLSSNLNEDDLSSLKKVVDHNVASLQQSLDNKQTQNKERLLERNICRQRQNSNGSPSTTNKDKWVINISNKQLNELETSFLRYGLDFSITPTNIPIPKILASKTV